LVDDFERQRANVLGMVDAMPESGLRTAPTEGVRDFAQQIEHVVGGNVSIIGSGVDRNASGLGDPEEYLNSKEQLKAFVNRGYDAVKEMIEGMTEEDLQAETSLFGQATVTKYRLIQTAYEHAVWTLGATVPYVRSQGGTPPGYNLIPGTSG
jgi:coenzyme F420-reducing hydrogenase alpha subunit